MAVKWICSSCGTVNIGEEAPVMECFVCGHVRDSEKLFRAGSEIVPVTAGEEDPSLPAPAERELPAAAPSGFGASLRSLGERLLAWWKGFFGKAGALPGRPSDEGTGGSGAGRGEAAGEEDDIIGWDIEISPDGSREAGLRARPVRDAMRRRETGPGHPSPEEPSAASPEEDPEPADLAPEESPWPEHRIRFRMDAMRAKGFVKAERAEMSGTKGYRLTDASGRDRFLTFSNMKMMGFAEDL